MGEKYLAQWNEKFFFKIHGLPGFPLKSFVSWQASNCLPFLRRPWKTIGLKFLTVNPYLSIFAIYLTSYRKRESYGWKMSRKVKSKVFLLKSTVFLASFWNLLFHDVLVIVFLLSEDIRLSEKDRVVPSIAGIGTCWIDHKCSMTGQKILFLDFRTVCSKHSKM